MAALALALGACGGSGTATGDLSGEVLAPRGSKEVPLQGQEVRLLSPELKDDLETLEEAYAQRVSQREALAASLDAARPDFEAALAAAQAREVAKVDVKVLYAKADPANGRFHLGLEVTNGTADGIGGLLFELWCDGTRMPASAKFGQLLPLRWEEQDLPPGGSRTLRPTGAAGEAARWKDAQGYATYVVHPRFAATDEGRPLLACTQDRLEIRPIGVLYYSDGQGFSPGTLQQSDPAAAAAGEKVDNLRARIKAMDVSDLDAALDEAIERRTLAVTRTDAAGKYHFGGVEPGTYLLSAKKSAWAKRGPFWLVEVAVEGSTRQDLGFFNLKDPRFSARWMRKPRKKPEAAPGAAPPGTAAAPAAK